MKHILLEFVHWQKYNNSIVDWKMLVSHKLNKLLARQTEVIVKSQNLIIHILHGICMDVLCSPFAYNSMCINVYPSWTFSHGTAIACFISALAFVHKLISVVLYNLHNFPILLSESIAKVWHSRVWFCSNVQLETWPMVWPKQCLA